MRRSGHGELEGCLQVRLLENGEHAARIRHLELAVEVHLAIDRIHEPVQPFAGIHIQRFGHNTELVRGGEFRQLDADAVGHLRRVQLLAIEHHLVHSVGHRIDEGGRASVGAESDHCRGTENLLSTREVEDDLVGLYIEQFRTPASFFTGQVHAWQSSASSVVSIKALRSAG